MIVCNFYTLIPICFQAIDLKGGYCIKVITMATVQLSVLNLFIEKYLCSQFVAVLFFYPVFLIKHQ